MKGMEKVVEAMQPAVRSPQQREPGMRRGLRARDARSLSASVCPKGFGGIAWPAVAF